LKEKQIIRKLGPNVLEEGCTLKQWLFQDSQTLLKKTCWPSAYCLLFKNKHFNSLDSLQALGSK